jgi:anti-anti-sigma factor
VNPHSSILVGQIGDVFWLRVEGKGCFQNSISVKSAVQDRIESGVRDFVFDLDRCPMMDSTFLGTLTGVARDLRDCGGGTVTVLNVNARNQQLLSSLGLDHILDVDIDGSAWPEERRQAACELEQCATSAAVVCKTEQAAHVLEAHQALCEANEANSSRFRDVIDFLQKEVGRKSLLTTAQ